MKLADFAPVGHTGNLLMGEAVVPKDLLFVDGMSGKGYKVKQAEYARIGAMTPGVTQTSEATGMVVAQTTISSSSGIYYYHRPAVLKDATTGNIYTLADNVASGGMTLTMLSAIGTLLAQVILQVATQRYAPIILQLANGNIACIYFNNISTLVYAVYTSNLVAVVTETSISSIYGSGFYNSAIALSGGGFAVLFHDGATVLNNNFITYDNDGVVVQAETTVFIRTGTNGYQNQAMAQLSNGNIAIAINSQNTIASIGLYYGVITIAGAIVKAFTLINSQSSTNVPYIAVLPGFFAISLMNTVVQLANVYNNAGTLQGTGFSEATSAGNGAQITKLIAGDSAFWLAWHVNINGIAKLTKLPTSGTGYITKNFLNFPGGTGPFNVVMDIFIENATLVWAYQTSGAAVPRFITIDLVTLSVIKGVSTIFGVSTTSAGTSIRIIPGGDSTFIAVYTHASNAGTYLCIGKYTGTAVIGVAQNTVSAGAQGRLLIAPGVYEINTLSGVGSINFDHTANTVIGHSGTILPNSIILKGFGV